MSNKSDTKTVYADYCGTSQFEIPLEVKKYSVIWNKLLYTDIEGVEHQVEPTVDVEDDVELFKRPTKIRSETEGFGGGLRDEDTGELVSYEEYRRRGKVFRYKARAEWFGDVISAFRILLTRPYLGRVKIICPSIQGSFLGCAVFDFYTFTPLKELQDIWNKEGQDIHRIVMTIKDYDEYDGHFNSYYK